ncbi:glycosyltransferase family 4 protein [Paenibacillus sp. CAA11]|uniref:glycosyltransferase family 4 protein n=1 Tax=Paenibacillus sp. CAA11 TaxID=1532905 RepID=UPI00131F3C9C|nr:glycosyltransferase family 4 protein [Paenibacillus sp. CAA11]
MRILLCTYWTYPHVGGLCTYINNIKDGMERLGHKVDIFAHHPSYTTYYTVGRSDQTFPKLPIWRPLYNYIQALYAEALPKQAVKIIEVEAERYSYEAACSLLRFEDYDVIHAQDVISAAALSRIKPPHIPLISTIHGWFTNEYSLDHPNSEEGTPTWDYNLLLDYWGTTGSDITIVPSKWLGGIFADKLNVPPRQIVHIPYAMHWNAHPPEDEVVKELGNDKDRTVISCVARLCPVKGQHYLLEALSMLKQEHHDWICYFLGDGPQRSELEQKAEELGLQAYVRFVGNQNNVASWLEYTDIFVLPSLQDNFPFAVMEAQFSGKAVVVTDAGGTVEMVEHLRTGLIANKASGESLYTQIKKLMEDEVLRKRLGEQASIWAKSAWSMDLMISRTVSIYNDLLFSEGGKAVVSRENGRQMTEQALKSKYAFLNDKALSGEDLKVWREILQRLPEDYVVPDPRVKKLIKSLSV